MSDPITSEEFQRAARPLTTGNIVLDYGLAILRAEPVAELPDPPQATRALCKARWPQPGAGRQRSRGDPSRRCAGWERGSSTPSPEHAGAYARLLGLLAS